MKNGKKEIFSWCLYDWANSAFATTVMAGFFPVFFKQFWCAGADATLSSARLGIGNSIIGFTIAILSPLLGSLADAGHARKKFLMFLMLFGTASCGLLSVIPSGNWTAALIIYAMASIGFFCGNLFYDSLLVDVAECGTERDTVSSRGYAFGYLGGGLLFLLNVIMVTKPEVFGLAGKSAAIKWSFVTVAVWWAFFSIPVLAVVKEKNADRRVKIGSVVGSSLSRIFGIFADIKRTPGLLLFLIAYWLYIDGVGTFISMSVDFGLAIGFSSTTMLTGLLLVQFVAFPAALGFGFLAKKIGAQRAIMTGIAIYLGVTIVGALTINTPAHLYVLAGIVALAQGGIQALSRSYFANMIPEDKAAEYFGFYNMVGKFAVILGPSIVGVTAFVLHRAGVESHLSSRLGMCMLSILFISGGILFVKSNRLRKNGACIS